MCALLADSRVLELNGDIMGMVALTYKVMPDSDVEDVSTDDVVEQIMALKDETYDVQLCESKPLAFGLKFIQVHVVMNDGSGLSDIFEENMRAIRGTGEIEVLSMGLL
jgi:translation elongation factor aEF-1 beta|tara:strand:- start:268 stop:591 length:324 start_codon:yes stop_codon:yes gene_type:complete